MHGDQVNNLKRMFMIENIMEESLVLKSTNQIVMKKKIRIMTTIIIVNIENQDNEYASYAVVKAIMQ